MSSPDVTLSIAAVALYLVAIILIGFEITFKKESLGRIWQISVGLAILVQGGALLARAILSREVPLTDLFEYTLVLTWALALIFFIFFRKPFPRQASLVLLVVVNLLLGISFLYYTDPKGATMPALRSFWLYVHVSLAALGETFFGIAFVASLVEIVKGERGVDEGLGEMAYRAISMGFPLFTAGALVAGAIWAKQAWGSYWSWDPKEVLSLVVWLVYAAYLHARLVRGFTGRLLAGISIIGFVLTLFTIFGSLILGGLHAYS